MSRFLVLLTMALAWPAMAAPRPNVLFIAIDDLNDWIGCIGNHPLVRTPHMDALAARGTLFLNAHCQAPLCNPSRTSIMTGLRPSTSGVYGLAPWFRQVDALRDRVTLPQYFKKHGYTTYTAGKIYHGGYPPGPRRHDEFDHWGPGAGVGAAPPQKLVHTPFGDHPLVDWGTFPHRDEDKGDWKIASWATDLFERKPREPFFLAVGFFLPHVPCYATQPWFDLYPNDESILPPILERDRSDTPRFSWYTHWKLPEVRLDWLRKERQWIPITRAYLACVSFVDSQVGRVLEALRSSGLEDNTVVALWSDHGWHLGEKEMTGKNTLWDRSTRVPLIFAGPGISQGGRCVRPVELLDLYPTLAALCGLPACDDLEGHSLVPLLTNAEATRPWPAITTHNHDNHGIRTEQWRYIRYADGSEELYDMKADPREWHNLAGDPSVRGAIEELRQGLPRHSLMPVPGSASRVLVYTNGIPNWEGNVIHPEDPIPME